MKRISLFVLFICTIFSCLSAQTGKENERIKQNYIRSIIGMDEEKQPYLQLLSKIPPEKEVSDQNVIELQQLYPMDVFGKVFILQSDFDADLIPVFFFQGTDAFYIFR